jgi:preprotein translocase subunit SecB
MASQPTTPGTDAVANGEDTAPTAGLISQYVKDLSFENPNAPAIYQAQTAPQIDVQFNISSGQIGEEVHEVTLKIEVRADSEGTVAFIVDLTYSGLFGFRNVPADQIQPYLLAEGPRLLFPFARRVVADTIRDGGFPALLLEPIDFAQLYMQQSQQQGAMSVAGHA